ncbi:hypothetical protein [Parenemella sanctibonifatiensis]|uniref:Uncharacterized protein n=1 Tax=Parenemella sanctibonifatiensis TaxID=2016505 RepID=A0A255ESL6_9ACTN|nr:hypothetical protein [Parenemella sanctibonifatiensis]OYN91113.1 hypothetical protein CGZ91_06540 [Parenemella sanctibonifatiensis]
MLPSSHPLEAEIDAAVTAYGALPTENRYGCLAMAGPSYVILHEYADGALVPVTVDLGGCPTAQLGTDPDRAPRYEVTPWMATLTELWQSGQHAPDDPATVAPCGETWATLIAPRPADLRVASICLAPGAPESLELRASEVAAVADVLGGEPLESSQEADRPHLEEFRPVRITLADPWGNTMTVRFLGDVLYIDGAFGPQVYYAVPAELAQRLQPKIDRLP